MSTVADRDLLVHIKGLKTWFHTEDRIVKAVDFEPETEIRIGRGETLGVVGESGSGKSVTALSLMRLLPPRRRASRPGRSRSSAATSWASLQREMRSIRGKDIGMIFQEPMTSLNPVFTVGDQVMEAILIHEERLPGAGAAARPRALPRGRTSPTPSGASTATRTRCPAARSSAS